jgi:hypothetical protein
VRVVGWLSEVYSGIQAGVTDYRAGLRRLNRREYLRQHAETRRAADKAAGARRIDVTLRGQGLNDFESVKQWIEGVNRMAIERGIFGASRTAPDGTVYTIPPYRLSDTEIIKPALQLAASKIANDQA